MIVSVLVFFFFFNDTATTEIYTLSLHDALPICAHTPRQGAHQSRRHRGARHPARRGDSAAAILRTVHAVEYPRRLSRAAELRRGGGAHRSRGSRAIHDPAADSARLVAPLAPGDSAVSRCRRPGGIHLSVDPSRSAHGRVAARGERAGGASGPRERRCVDDVLSPAGTGRGARCVAPDGRWSRAASRAADSGPAHGAVVLLSGADGEPGWLCGAGSGGMAVTAPPRCARSPAP